MHFSVIGSKERLTNGNSTNGVAQADCADLMRLQLLDICRCLMALDENLVFPRRDTVNGIQRLMKSAQVRIWIHMMGLVKFVERLCDCSDVLFIRVCVCVCVRSLQIESQ